MASPRVTLATPRLCDRALNAGAPCYIDRMYSRPLAYFLTWHTYGTWLHGREEGSVDRRNNRYGTPLIKPNAIRQAKARDRMKHEPVVLSIKARAIIEAVIREHCALRKWHIHALAVRTNHVHLVVDAGDVPPEQAVSQLKQWGTRRLREKSVIDAEQPVWSRQSSRRQLFEESALHNAICYTLEGQDRRKPRASVPSASN